MRRSYRGAAAAFPIEGESSYQDRITEYAELRGWLKHHEHDSRHSSAGWPDLELVRGDRHVRAEVKRRGEEPRPDQDVILEAMTRAGRVEVYVWHPHECGRPGHYAWPDTMRILT